jgi:hypothetical protein
MRLLSYSVRNLRSFLKPATIPVRPITLLVGANSTGKSTLLRMLPLLRQSVETKTKGPLLWFGPYVDFGSFEDIQTKNGDLKDVLLGFKVRVQEDPHPLWYSVAITSEDIEIDIQIGLCRDSASASTYINLVNACIESHTISARFDKNGQISSFSLNDEELPLNGLSIQLKHDSNLFAVELSFEVEKRSKAADWKWRNSIYERLLLEASLLSHVDCLFHGRTEIDTRREFIKRLGISSLEILRENLVNSKGLSDFTSKRIALCINDSDWLHKFQGLLIADRLPRILSDLDLGLGSLLKNITYMGPIRATASRYYRQQDLATDEVDSEGANMAMFLAGLSEDDRSSFSVWCQESMGFSVSVSTSSSHVSILIGDSAGDGQYNIADMGFGYSQILPLLTTMWSSQRSKGDDKSSSSDYFNPARYHSNQTILVVEQPELHLHPRLQAKLADLYCNIISQSERSGSDISFVIETHSETLINRIGGLIRDKRISSSDVAVLIVDKECGCSSIKPAMFDDDGFLMNWPYGFFLP